MSDLHTYRFPFNDGSVFKTNATEYKYAISNLHATFTESQIHDRGGLVEMEEEKEPEVVKTYSMVSVAKHVRIPVRILRDWVRLGHVAASWDDKRGSVMTDAQVKAVIDYKREVEESCERYCGKSMTSCTD